mmetsp:Transcript_3246/g.9945  ORF Transcript_3246/g.9945 Transcript_3246/m.9945 type:complete len:212 (+) Transcript_3246:291-926(+)
MRLLSFVVVVFGVASSFVLADAQVGIGAIGVVPLAGGEEFGAVLVPGAVGLARKPGGVDDVGDGTVAGPSEGPFGVAVIVSEPHGRARGVELSDEGVFDVVPRTRRVATDDQCGAFVLAALEVQALARGVEALAFVAVEFKEGRAGRLRFRCGGKDLVGVGGTRETCADDSLRSGDGDRRAELVVLVEVARRQLGLADPGPRLAVVDRLEN